MPCLRPLEAWAAPGGVSFDRKRSFGISVTLPCGQCQGCRVDRAQMWTLRIVQESKLHALSSFVTLTYSDEHLPDGCTLDKRHVQLFMKRLRRRISPVRVSYFAVGEYGELGLRPHYHAILFGWYPPDAPVKDGRAVGSRFLEEVWQLGHVSVGTVTEASAGYCAQYAVKKVRCGLDSSAYMDKHYRRVDSETGCTWLVEPEFAVMSRNPAIGRRFYEKFAADFFPSDFALLRGKKVRVPRYYDKLFKASDPVAQDKVAFARLQRARTHKDDQTPERLAVRGKVLNAKLANRAGRKL